MKRHLFRTLILLGGALATVGPVAAQYPYPPNAPTGVGGYPGGGTPPISPYLNILQGNGNPAVNYYNFTRPALQAQQFYQQQQAFGLPPVEPFGLASQDVSLLPQLDPANKLPRPTGHPTAFMNYGGYFNSLGTIGPMGARGAGVSPRPQVQTGRR